MKRRALKRRYGHTKARTYRGWRIEPETTTQVGHKLPDRRNVMQQDGLRTRRKVKGYLLHGPDGATKFVDTLADAHRYIDQYEGVS